MIRSRDEREMEGVFCVTNMAWAIATADFSDELCKIIRRQGVWPDAIIYSALISVCENLEPCKIIRRQGSVLDNSPTAL